MREPSKWSPVPPADRDEDAWRSWADGHPVSAAMGLMCTGAHDADTEFRLDGTSLPNPNGSVHGGVLAAALDQALAIATMRTMEVGFLPNTATMNVQYLRPALPPLRLRSRVTKPGRAITFAHAEVYARDGRLCATADGSFAMIAAAEAMRKR